MRERLRAWRPNKKVCRGHKFATTLDPLGSGQDYATKAQPSCADLGAGSQWTWQSHTPLISEAEDHACGFGGCNPVVSEDGRTPFFSKETGMIGAAHVWQASRQSSDVPFGAHRAVPELASYVAYPGWLSPDGCRLYLRREDPELPDSVLFYVSQR
jgi:hypothetical protein